MTESPTLSPELVLVSPDLRELALSRLPLPGHFAPASVTAAAGGALSAPLVVAPPIVAPLIVAPPVAAPPAPAAVVPPRRRVPLALAAAVYLVVGLATRVVSGVVLAAGLVGAYSLFHG